MNNIHPHLKDPLKNPVKEENTYIPAQQNILEASPLKRPKKNSTPIREKQIRSDRQTSRETAARSGEKKENPPIVPPWWPEGFAGFWDAYPRKIGRAKALAEWNELKPDGALAQQIADSLERATRSSDWTNDDGRYIPHPATYLRDARWTDEYSDDELIIELPQAGQGAAA